MAFLGIDLGTGGVRCLLVDEKGNILTQASRLIERQNLSLEEGKSEQNPMDWIRSLESAFDELFTPDSAFARKIQAVAVDGTSGTILPVSKTGGVLGPALMHNDMRAVREAESCAELFGGSCSPTFALPKALWMNNNCSLPDDCLFFHATDFLNSWLSGTTLIPTDYTSALKTGVDLEMETWSKNHLLSEIQLPPVVAPGKRIGELATSISKRWGLPKKVVLVSGATDSNAAFYASGARGAGDWSSTIGTTIAVKGLSSRKLIDPHCRIYQHKHPDGFWLSGGASNAGGEILRSRYTGREEQVERKAHSIKVGTCQIYPSTRIGERLPFASSTFRPFQSPKELDEPSFYRGCLEGMAYLESMTYSLIQSLGVEVGEKIYATGGMTKSSLGMQIRADVLQKCLLVPSNPHSAMGAAVLAAAGFHQHSIGQMSESMVSISHQVDPNKGADRYYAESFLEFRNLCENQLT